MRTVGALACAALLISSSVAAAPGRAGKTLRISGGSPYEADCESPHEGDLFKGAETEPHLAVNPTDPNNVIAAWQQDRFEEGASLGNVVTVSQDGGRTFKQALIPEHSPCTGSTFERVSDPWVSIGPDGTIYFTSLLIDFYGDEGTAFLVSRSVDKGVTWETEVVSAPEGRAFVLGAQDKQTLTADPINPGYAYLIWSTFGPHGTTTHFARTNDGGQSWEMPRPISVLPAAGSIDIGNIIVVTTDGTLLNLFARITNFGLPDATVALMQMQSTDQGLTWTLPEQIAGFDARPIVDPRSGQTLRTAESIFSAAAGPDGTAYITFQVNTAAGQGAVMVMSSTDNGGTWSAPRAAVLSERQLFNPVVATSEQGVVALTYYGLRAVEADTPTLPSDVFFAHSHDLETWTRVHLAGPFDMSTAPNSNRGPFVGDYFGLAARGPDRFATLSILARPKAKEGATDAFYREVSVSP